ncbi:lactonase family protein [Sorangium sp. So ce1036]|uniref:lactonase family protein n=1 Tax=Sorangium sp. So ce1036 TaxID=3133328 RepID=UPI003F04D709
MQRTLFWLAAGLWLGCGGSGATGHGSQAGASGGGGDSSHPGSGTGDRSSAGGGDTGAGAGGSGMGSTGVGGSGEESTGAGGGGESTGAGGGASAPAGVPFVYVGGHQGIFVFRLDESDGSLSAVEGPIDAEMNPTFLAVDPAHRHLFAVNELGEVDGERSGAVSAYRINPADGTLTFLNRVSSKGAGPAHLAVDRAGRFVLVANYGGGTAAVLPIGQDGALGQAVSEAVFPGRLPRSHHIVTAPSNRFAFVTNLGLDAIAQLTFDPDTGQMAPNDPPALSLPPGTTPRHLDFHPSRTLAYVIHESSDASTTLGYDPQKGTLAALSTVSTLPDGVSGLANTCAEIQVAPTGRFVYGSNRGHDSIAIFAVDAGTGALTAVGHQPTQGKTPRHFQLSPTGKLLLVANQDSDSIVAFHVDETTGALEPTGRVTEVPRPTYVGIVAPSGR